MLEEAIAKSQDILKTSLNKTGFGIDRLTGYLSTATGKGIRARLLLICAMDKNGLIHDDAIKVAAAIEILHLASLVHDDVMDGATSRRGIATLNSRFDSKTAVIVGDYLLSIAMRIVSDIDYKRIETEKHAPFFPQISRMLDSLTRGEYLQHVNLGNVDINMLTYFKIISGKTASIFYISCYLGSVLSGEQIDQSKKLGRFGHSLGMAFQIVDDVKDYMWNQEKAGKNIESDLKNGVITLPAILAMKKNPNLKFLIKEAIALKKDTENIVKMIKNSTSVKETNQISYRYIEICNNNLNNICEIKKNNLSTILDKIGGQV